MRRRLTPSLIAASGAVVVASVLPGAVVAGTDDGSAERVSGRAGTGDGSADRVSAPSATPRARLAVVRLVSCIPEEHEAVYQARMTAISGTHRMAVRYALRSQSPGKAEARVRVPGLTKWRRSKSGVATFAWKQELLNLAAGATYRVQVDFRWFDAARNVLRRQRVRSAPCRQYSDLPNLKVRLVGSAPGEMAGTSRYRVRVDNNGAATAAGAALRLSVDGTVAQTQQLAALAAGESRIVTVVGPACTQWVEGVVDPEDALVELSESDNSHSLACADLARR